MTHKRLNVVATVLSVSPLWAAMQAHALPGQSVADVSSWIDSHPVFGSSQLIPPNDPTTHPAYVNLYQTEQVPYGNGAIHFSADTGSFRGPQNPVTAEYIHLAGGQPRLIGKMRLVMR